MAYNPIINILQKPLQERKEIYGTNDIQKIIIDGNVFTGYKTFSSFWEITYAKEPERSEGGVINNLNSIATFVTPHIKIDFAMIDIDQYRKLYKLMLDRREFTVKYYDVVEGKVTTQNMYFAPDQLPTLYAIARRLNGEKFVEVLGVQNYTIELIGTNSDLDKVEILYYDENGNLLHTQEATKGDEIIVNYDYAPSNSLVRFDGVWRKDKNEETASTVNNGAVITANTTSIDERSIRLYAKVKDSNQYILSLDYGNGKIPVPQNANNDVNSFKISYGETYKTAIMRSLILLSNGEYLSLDNLLKGTGSKTVQYNNENVEAFDFQGWYSVNKIDDNYKISVSSLYNYNFNKTIYQIYTPKKFNVQYLGENLYIQSQNIEYGSNVPLPKFSLNDKTITGWYLDEAFTKSFNGIMPPANISIYAKWEKIK